MDTAPQRPPRWLWRASWLMLTLALALSVAGAMALGGGLADPPRAGPLVWQESAPKPWTFATGDLQFRELPFRLPAPPYTLEVAARFSGASPASARWTVGLYPPMRFLRRRVTISPFTIMAIMKWA